MAMNAILVACYLLTAVVTCYLTWRRAANRLMDTLSWVDRNWDAPVSLHLTITVTFFCTWLFMGLGAGMVVMALVRLGLEVALK